MRPIEPRTCFMGCIYCAMEAIIDGPVLYTQSRPAFQVAQNVSGWQCLSPLGRTLRVSLGF
jgi:hypothetical protein